MENHRMDQLISMLKELEGIVEKETAKKLEVKKCNRIIQKLHSFITDCEICEQYFNDLESRIIRIRDKEVQLTMGEIDQLKQEIDHISTHLQEEHKLVSSGYYLSIYMTMGMSLGVVLGLLVLDNIALWLPLGFGIGITVGAAIDADAEKKGMVL